MKILVVLLITLLATAASAQILNPTNTMYPPSFGPYSTQTVTVGQSGNAYNPTLGPQAVAWGDVPALSLDGWTTVSNNANAVTRTLYAVNYGAKCDNATDDTVALQKFFTAVQATRAAAGILPPGSCRFSSTLNFPTNFNSIKGSGKYTTNLYYIGSSTTSDLVDIFGGTPPGIAVSNTYSGFSISSGTTMTGGSALNIKWMAEVWVDDFTVGAFYDYTHNLYNGVTVQSSGEIRLSHFEASSDAHDGVQIFGNGVGAPPQYDINIVNFEIQGDTNSGIHVGGGWDGVNIDQGTLVGNGTNLLIDTGLSSYGNQEIIVGPLAYFNLAATNGTNLGDNITINDSLATPSNYCSVDIRGVVADSVYGNGINIVHWPNCLVSVSSTDIVNNHKQGIYVQDASTIVNVSNATQIYGNGQYGISASSYTPNVHSLANYASNASGAYANIQAPSGVMSQSGIPMIVPSSGTVGNNCAISGLTALSYAFPAAYLYLPAGAIATGSAAGLYYTVMSSNTAGTCYSNIYTTGTPTVPSTPTAFATTGPGAFTQTTNAVPLLSQAFAGGAIGLNGEVDFDYAISVSNTGNNKTQSLYLSGGAQLAQTVLTNAAQTYSYKMRNAGSQNVQYTVAQSGGVVSRNTVNETAGWSATVYCQLATATDWCLIDSYSIKVYPN